MGSSEFSKNMFSQQNSPCLHDCVYRQQAQGNRWVIRNRKSLKIQMYLAPVWISSGFCACLTDDHFGTLSKCGLWLSRFGAGLRSCLLISSPGDAIAPLWKISEVTTSWACFLPQIWLFFCSLPTFSYFQTRSSLAGTDSQDIEHFSILLPCNFAFYSSLQKGYWLWGIV